MPRAYLEGSLFDALHFTNIEMADTVATSSFAEADKDASSSIAASPHKLYHVFINHRGCDVKKTFASHLYHRLCSARIGLRVFLDQPEMRAGRTFISQIKDAITSASVHVAIFSPRYAESEWCLDELLYMVDSNSLIIPVFYHVEPSAVWWPDDKGVYAEALRILEKKKASDSQKPRHDPATIKKWKDALSAVSEISGFDLDAGPFYGDEGEVVERIVQRVLEEIKSTSGYYCTQPYGGLGGNYWNDGTYSGIKGITMTAQDNLLTSVQLYYGLGGKNGNIPGHRHGSEVGDKMEYTLNYPEEIVTKISGYIKLSGRILITSLTFHTNQRKLGPCGQEQGTPFETEERGKIVGIFGSSGSLVNSIGAYMLKPRAATHEEFYCCRGYGGHRGNEWSDGTYSGVRRISVTANEHALTSFQVHYGLEGDGRNFSSQPHGGRVGPPHQGALGNRSEYSLNYPDEILTKISGRFGRYKAWPEPESWVVIKSLTFYTNKAKYGPCGHEQGTPFETEEGEKIVGFFGSSGSLLDSIGVYMLKPR